MLDALECFRLAHPDEPLFVDRVWLGFSLILITITSFILNILLLIITTRTSILDALFRFHVISFILASIVYLMANTFALIPTTIIPLHIADPWNAVLSSTDNLGYLALMFTNTNVAIDRFVFFFMPEVHRWLVNRKKLFIVFTTLPWMGSILITVLMAFEGCLTRTDPYTLTFTYSCSTCTIYGPVLIYFGYIFPGINFVLYASIYAQIISMFMKLESSSCIKESISDSKLQKRKIKLVFQFSIICAIQFASSACFYVLPPLLPGNDLAFYLPMVISSLNTMTNPVVMLLFQPRVRNAYIILLVERSVESIRGTTITIRPTRLS